MQGYVFLPALYAWPNLSADFHQIWLILWMAIHCLLGKVLSWDFFCHS